ncbi:MAG: pilus assembly protein TadG-related protein [bacterium]
MLTKLRLLWHDQQGTVLVVVAVGIIALLGLAAIVSDIGLLYLHRTQLVNGVDAAALAGVMELPQDRVQAEAEAASFAAANGLMPAELQIEVAADQQQISVRATRTVSLFLARVLGFEESVVSARAVAQVAPVTAVRGVIPLGVEWEDFAFGETYNLKEGGGDGTKGNYGILALGGTGANVYRENLANGYQQVIEVGQVIITEPGAMVGPTKGPIKDRINGCNHNPACTWESFDPDCPRVVIVPIVEGVLQGRSEVEVVGFAAFFLEGVGGSADVQGRFIKLLIEGESSPDQQNFGLVAGKLIE